LRKLDTQVSDQIIRYLAQRAAALPDPQLLASELAGEWQGLWRFRLGDYRVICDIREEERIILALVIGYRKNVYK
jgi:mRNA interferase RelE/StbE